MKSAVGLAHTHSIFPGGFAEEKLKSAKSVLRICGLTVTGVGVAVLLLWLHYRYEAWQYNECLGIGYSAEYCSAQQQPAPVQ